MERIIQIEATPETFSERQALYALTNSGRIFVSINHEEWSKVPLPPLHTNELKEDENTNLSNK